MHLHLTPPPIGQQRDRMFPSADSPHGAGPAVVGQAGEQMIHSGRALKCVIDDLSRTTNRPGFDLRCPTSYATGVLLHNFPAHGALDAPAHRLGIPSEVSEDVADGPTW